MKSGVSRIYIVKARGFFVQLCFLGYVYYILHNHIHLFEEKAILRTMFLKACFTCWFLSVYMKGFKRGATEVLSTATPLFKVTLALAEGLMHLKTQLP